LSNPFEVIEARLSSIENLILDLKHKKTEQDKTSSLTEKLLSVKEAAQFLKLTVPTIYSKCSRNELPYMKRSKRLYFNTDELMSYLKEGRKKPISEIEAEVEQYLPTNKKGLIN